jgi:hypothetical protein
MISFRTPETPIITHLKSTRESIETEVYIDCDIKLSDHEKNFNHSILKNICYRYLFYLNDQLELGFNYANENITNTIFVESLKKSSLANNLYQLMKNKSDQWPEKFSLSIKLEYLSNIFLNSNNLIFSSNELNEFYTQISSNHTKSKEIVNNVTQVLTNNFDSNRQGMIKGILVSHNNLYLFINHFCYLRL